MICVTAIFAFIFTSNLIIYSKGFSGDMLPLGCLNGFPASVPHRVDTIFHTQLPFYTSTIPLDLGILHGLAISVSRGMDVPKTSV